MNDKFMEFVQQQTAVSDEDEAGAMTVELEKERWLSKLGELEKFVETSLSAYASSGIQTSTKMVEVTEEQTGTYLAPQIEIAVGPSLVKLKPIGTFLIGAWGRVDMDGPRGVCRLILVPRAAKKPLFSFDSESKSEPPVTSDLVWKIMPAPPAMAYVELSSEIFLDMLMKVVRGG